MRLFPRCSRGLGHPKGDKRLLEIVGVWSFKRRGLPRERVMDLESEGVQGSPSNEVCQRRPVQGIRQ